MEGLLWRSYPPVFVADTDKISDSLAAKMWRANFMIVLKYLVTYVRAVSLPCNCPSV